MAKKVGTYQIPFDENGSQLHYPEWRQKEWRENYAFDDVLQYESFSRGRSAAYIHMVRKDGTKVTVFLKDFEEMIPLMVNGFVSGRFSFIKRGQNYGCTRLGDASDNG